LSWPSLSLDGPVSLAIALCPFSWWQPPLASCLEYWIEFPAIHMVGDICWVLCRILGPGCFPAALSVCPPVPGGKGGRYHCPSQQQRTFASLNIGAYSHPSCSRQSSPRIHGEVGTLAVCLVCLCVADSLLPLSRVSLPPLPSAPPRPLCHRCSSPVPLLLETPVKLWCLAAGLSGGPQKV
jgi:hypothetical protein